MASGDVDQALSKPRPIPDGFEIVHVGAEDPERIAAVARLFAAYTDSLGIDLAYQNYAAELAGLPGKYGPPDGALLLVVRSHSRDTGGEVEEDNEAAAVGCVALRPLPDVHDTTADTADVSTRKGRKRRRAEIKRLYVDPAARGHRLGRALFAAVLAEARAKGYDEVVLDTLAHMVEARRIYEREGFAALEEPYYEVAAGAGGEESRHPDGTVFYRLEL
ncbi:N-acetyltransferase [Apiospora aurea]|uniref:N-acetyltransferase n=1 Tax=Apiospora aurea TaxID=335848 RepID=A0ABR1QAK3_9PEZI